MVNDLRSLGISIGTYLLTDVVRQQGLFDLGGDGLGVEILGQCCHLVDGRRNVLMKGTSHGVDAGWWSRLLAWGGRLLG